VKSSFPKGRNLSGLKIVVDCAHGAAYKVAPTVLWESGAPRSSPVACEPDGTNINKQCGAVHPQTMQSQVVAHGADLGIALDGDADRLIVGGREGRGARR
jgi:phosphoglucosamine mutase